MAHLYRAFGHALTSACELPELETTTRGDPPGAAPDPSIAVTVGPPCSAPAPDAPCVRSDTADATETRASVRCQDSWLRVDRHSGGYVLRFGEAATFSVSADARSVHVHQFETRLQRDVRHLLLDHVVPLMLAHRGSLVLHASAVVIDGRAIALVGPSGAGKSTLAGAMARQSGAVLADDAVLIEVRGEQAHAMPAYPSLRVWPDALLPLGFNGRAPRVSDDTEKRRISLVFGSASGSPAGAVRFADRAYPLSRLYVLSAAETGEACVSPVSKRAAAMTVLENSYVLDAADTRRLERQLIAACDVIDRVAARSLSYSRDLLRLGEVTAAIARDLQ